LRLCQLDRAEKNLEELNLGKMTQDKLKRIQKGWTEIRVVKKSRVDKRREVVRRVKKRWHEFMRCEDR
jgi:hypothetical protein